MTAMLTALTVVGVVLAGVGSFLLHDRRPGHRGIALATELCGWAALGLSWIVGALPQNAADCYAPGSDCPDSVLGFFWVLLRGPLVEASAAAAAFLAGWAVANLLPSHGTEDYSDIADQLPLFVAGAPPPAAPLVAAASRPPRLRRADSSPVGGRARVTANDKIAHLLDPSGRSACGRVLEDYRPARQETRLCQLCEKRSSAAVQRPRSSSDGGQGVVR